MPKILSISIPLTVSLFLATYVVFSPLNAFIEHFLDFHLDLDSIPCPPQQGYADENGVVWEHEAFYEADKYYRNEGTYGGDNDRSQSEGTSGPPDRDQ